MAMEKSLKRVTGNIKFKNPTGKGKLKSPVGGRAPRLRSPLK